MEKGLFSMSEKYVLTALLSKGAFEGQRSLRFNDLRRELDKESFRMPETGKPMATPTLIRNLRKLEKSGWVKRQKIGKQNISYCLRDHPEMRARGDVLSWYEKNRKNINSLSFDKLSSALVNFACIHALELLRLKLKHIAGKLSDIEYNLHHGYMDTLYSAILRMLIGRITEDKERFKREINGVIRDITDSIETLQAK